MRAKPGYNSLAAESRLFQWRRQPSERLVAMAAMVRNPL